MDHTKQEQARHLYFAQAKTQKEIAQMLNICEKTVYNWIRRFSWDKMREAARKAPALISENLCSQIVELQNSIGRREPGLRYATAEESRIMQRLITMLDKMKRYVGLSMNMQIIGNFRNWASTRDKSFARDLGLYSGLFLQGYAQNGYYPYELEFGMDKINPFDPYYKEDPEEEPKSGKQDVIVSLSNDIEGPKPGNEIIVPKLQNDAAVSDCHPQPAEGGMNDNAQSLSPELSSRACRAVNPAGKPAQNIDNQSGCHPELAEGPLLAPVKTGKNPVNSTPPSDTPWHNSLRKQNDNDQTLNTKRE